MGETYALLMGAFIMGLTTQVHCIGMCGPVIGILGINNSYKRIPAAILYNLGRISTYTFLGVIGGLIGFFVSDITTLQYVIRYLAGAIMIFIALQLFGMPQFLAFVEKPAQKLWKPIQKFSQRFFPIKTAKGTYFMGFIWGFLPCGAVYGPLAVAIGLGSVGMSAALMFSFGLGTLPVMIALAIFGNYVGRYLAKPSIRRLGGIVILLMTVYYLGWIAPPEKVNKRAAKLSETTEQVQHGGDALKALEGSKMGGHGGGKMPMHGDMKGDMKGQMQGEMKSDMKPMDGSMKGMKGDAKEMQNQPKGGMMNPSMKNDSSAAPEESAPMNGAAKMEAQ